MFWAPPQIGGRASSSCSPIWLRENTFHLLETNDRRNLARFALNQKGHFDTCSPSLRLNHLKIVKRLLGASKIQATNLVISDGLAAFGLKLWIEFEGIPAKPSIIDVLGDGRSSPSSVPS